MAYARFNTALERIREVVEQSAGTFRPVPTGRFSGELPEGLSDESAMAKAASVPRVEASITSIEPSSSSPPALGDVRIYEVQVTVKVVRVLSPLEQVSDADRDELHALAAQDADVLSQALGFPGNLARTAAGVDTEIVSGLLVYRSSSVLVKKPADDGAQPVITSHVFRGHMLSRPEPGFKSTDFVLFVDTRILIANFLVNDGPSIKSATGTQGFTFYGVGTYDIDWGDGTMDVSVTGTQTHAYSSPGTYQVRAKNWAGLSRRYACPDSSTTDAIKILELRSWGVTQWTSLANMFLNCTSMVGTYFDKPNLSAPGAKSMASMFRRARSFNGSPYSSMNEWDISSVNSLAQTFDLAEAFNQDLDKWDTSSVTTLASTFANAKSFNGKVGSWNTSKVTDMSTTFGAGNGTSLMKFNQDVGSWDTGKVTSMFRMFQRCVDFNQNINKWNVSNVVNFESMLVITSFNQPLDMWDVSKGQNFTAMFGSTISFSVFNQDISSWNMSSATNMNQMFINCFLFNQPIGSWNVSNVTNMLNLFNGATSFNHPLGAWDVAKVTNMNSMFAGATSFNQDLGAWVLNNNVSMANMLDQGTVGQGMSAENYSRTLIGWSNERKTSGTPINRSLGATNRRYNATVYGGTPFDNAVSARADLVLATGSGGGGWTITGDAQI